MIAKNLQKVGFYMNLYIDYIPAIIFFFEAQVKEINYKELRNIIR